MPTGLTSRSTEERPACARRTAVSMQASSDSRSYSIGYVPFGRLTRARSSLREVMRSFLYVLLSRCSTVQPAHRELFGDLSVAQAAAGQFGGLPLGGRQGGPLLGKGGVVGGVGPFQPGGQPPNAFGQAAGGVGDGEAGQFGQQAGRGGAVALGDVLGGEFGQDPGVGESGGQLARDEDGRADADGRFLAIEAERRTPGPGPVRSERPKDGRG